MSAAAWLWDVFIPDVDAGAAWANDLASAFDYAFGLLYGVATTKKWSNEQFDDGFVILSSAYESADGWLSDDVAGFWLALYEGFLYRPSNLPPGWDELRVTYGLAGGSTEAAAEAEKLAIAAPVDAVIQTAEDLSDIIDKAADIGVNLSEAAEAAAEAAEKLSGTGAGKAGFVALGIGLLILAMKR